jgi:hypothetical protein
MTNLVSKLDKIDKELRQEIKLEVDKGDGNRKLACLIRARADLESCINNLLELPKEE